MYGDWHEWFLSLCCMLATGAAVKLMDDYLDGDFDQCLGRRTLAVKLGRATLPYAMVLILIGAYCDLKLCLALFFGSYAVGMLNHWRDRLPTRVPAYVEMGLSAMLSIALTGAREALWGIAMMAVLDWLDDFMDRVADKAAGQANLAVRLGTAETLMLILFALCCAVLADSMHTVIAFIAAVILTGIAEMTTTCVWRKLEEDREVSVQ